jgi:site-specific DNA recombinase
MRKIDIIWTRYSSDMQRVESCEDQEREVRAGLARKGIDSSGFRVIHDRAESGTKNDRAQFEELRGMIQRDEVGILAVEDQSRLTRADNACCFITDLVYSRGRFISTGEGIDTEQEGWELRVKVVEINNRTTIHELARRVRRGQLGRVTDDGSAGDFPFGYESYHLDPNWTEAPRRGPKPKKGVRIFEPEAHWVRQVFTWFALEGKGVGWIARELTRLGVDRGHQATTLGWHHEQVHRMLSNSKYIGQWTWGRTRILRNSEGKTKQVQVPPEHQTIRDRPQLRIIDQETWEKARQRLRAMKEMYGQKPGQKGRGVKPHHTAMYPTSLLGGLIDCHACGARLWKQASRTRRYMFCPNSRKAICTMSGQLPLGKAEEALCNFLGELLSTWPEWIDSAVMAMVQALGAHADSIPDALRADQARLVQLEKKINNLVDLLADGAQESPALRERLVKLEGEAEGVRARLRETERFQKNTFTVPDPHWIQEELRNLLALCHEEPARMAHLFRRLFGRITAEAVLAPGKKRGYLRLHFRVNAPSVVQALLSERVPAALLDLVQLPAGHESPEFQLDLGKPTRYDEWAPQIVAMRAQGMIWSEIGRITGVGTGTAYNVWKRWTDAQPDTHSETG